MEHYENQSSSNLDLAQFDGGNSNAKNYTGNDCSIPGLSLPVVGVIGSASESKNNVVW